MCAVWRSMISPQRIDQRMRGVRADDAHRRADGRQRAAQLVGEHGDELVLGPRDLLLNGRRLPLIGDVLAGDDHPEEFARRRRARRAVRRHPAPLAVGAPHAGVGLERTARAQRLEQRPQVGAVVVVQRHAPAAVQRLLVR